MNRDKFAEVIGLNKQTIIKYEKDFKIPIPRDPENGYRIYGDEEIQIFKLIKEQLQNKTVSELQRDLKLKPDLLKLAPALLKETYNDDIDFIQSETPENINDLKNSISGLYENIQTLQQHVINQSDYFKDIKQLSENLSMSMYKIGQLEEKLKTEQQLHNISIEKYESEKRLITEYSTDYNKKLASEIETLKQDNDNKDKIINELKKELDKEKSKTLFQFVFKKKA